MSYIVVDFETYYDSEYSLRCMTPVEYLLDPRFECIGAGICEGDNGEPFWLDGHQLPAYFESKKHLPFISHNALFDMCIMSWRFGIVPPLMIDTMGMARATIAAFVRSLSLASVAQYYGLGAKGDAVINAKGLCGAALRANPVLWPRYVEYARNDAALCRGIYQRLRKTFPRQEYIVNDLIIRMTCEPGVILDRNVLALHANAVAAEKQALLARCGLTDRDMLMSNEKFAQALESLGVDPPMKISKTTGKETYAFAKTDQAMTDLEEHEDERVQALVAARLGHKSTLEETRTARFQAIANLDWQGRVHPCSMPLPLKYSGAHTHRASGDWKLNVQNLPRGGRLRDALMAPDGYKVVAGDASQIEARINALVCGQGDLVEDFRNKIDVYSSFASQQIYHYPVDKKNNPNERFVGKVSILSLGYQSGWRTFRGMIRVQSRSQLASEMILSETQAQAIVQAYRTRYPRISHAWRELQNALPLLAHYDSNFEFGPMRFRHQRIESPGGIHLYYDGLKQEVIDGQTRWRFTYNGKPKDLYGGKVLENMIQHLARLSNMDAAVRLRRRFPSSALVRWVLQVHDELVYVVRDDVVPEFRVALLEELSTPPAWAPGAPLAAEVGVGQTYGDAK